MLFPNIYRMLVKAGHSPFKAAEIVISAARGDRYSRLWIATLYSWRH